MALVTLLKLSIPIVSQLCAQPASHRSAILDLRAWGWGQCSQARDFCSRDKSGLLDASGFELCWVQLTWGPGVAQRCTSFCASVRTREQCCYCINSTQLTDSLEKLTNFYFLSRMMYM